MIFASRGLPKKPGRQPGVRYKRRSLFYSPDGLFSPPAEKQRHLSSRPSFIPHAAKMRAFQLLTAVSALFSMPVAHAQLLTLVCDRQATDACPGGSAITTNDCFRNCGCRPNGDIYCAKAVAGCSASLVQLFCEGFGDDGDPNCHCQ